MVKEYEKYLKFTNKQQTRDINKVLALLGGDDLLNGLTNDPILIDSNDEFTCIDNVSHAIKLCSEQPETGYFKALRIKWPQRNGQF